MNNSNSRYPFTLTQWQELEHQALIFKYMASGIPIPSDLLLPIKRSFFLSSTTSPALHSFTQPTLGWSSCYQMSYGRRAEDPEPGRCRRTDGKKWRCSKEAFPDSKYCERHMHRGKNRSRKPVEISLSNNNNTSNNSNTSNYYSSSSSLISPSSISSASEPHCPYNLMYPHPNTLTLEPGSYSSSAAHRDYSFMSDRRSSWELRPLGLGEPKQRGEVEEEEEKSKHCFVLGADFKQEKPVEKRYFIDDWTHKRKEGSWMGVEGESSSPRGSSSSSSYSKTQLSISIPMALHDFPQ